MKRHFAAVLALMLLAGTAPAQAPGNPEIGIAAAPTGDWKITYRLNEPARHIVFARSPDASRALRWKAPPNFEIAREGENEIARRRDGGPFTEVAFDVPPTYVDLPKDYAPFSPFGDGGILFYTGRFFACPESCEDEARWSMRLTVPAGRSILLDGRRFAGETAWRDGDNGRSVYIGETRPVETKELLAVLDGALPTAIRRPLGRRLPAFMHYFAARLGDLPERPMLFASYDLSHPNGWGRQGGTLPGQVFIHFYGRQWPEEMAKPDFANDLAWHFAHEAGHLYQRQLYSPAEEDAWIHEGGAEAFAAMALRASDAKAVPFVDSRIDAARSTCAKGLAGRSIRDAIAVGDFGVAYSCGLILNLHIDAEVRRAVPMSDGLYTVWRDYIERAEKSGGSEDAFLASVRQVANPALAETVKKAVRDPRCLALALDQ